MLIKKKNRLLTKIDLILLAVILMLSTVFPACVWVNNWNGSIPFISYTVITKDKALDLVNVAMSVRGAVVNNVTFRAVESNSVSLDPLNMIALAESGERLEIDTNGGNWVIKNGNRDFSLSYDVVTMKEDKYSSRIRKMITSITDRRFRALGRDIFLLPVLEVKEGIIVDFGFFPEAEIYSVYRSVGRRVIIPTADDLSMSLCVGGDYRYMSDSIGGTEILLASAGGWSFKENEIFQLIKDIVSYEIGMFGSSPHSRYLFVCDRNPIFGSKGFDYYGAHFGGNVLLLFDSQMDRSDLFNIQMAVISHEFFHNWNGEALSPASDNFQWFTEGVTVYYSYKILLDLGIISNRQYEFKRDSILENYQQNPYLDNTPISSSGNSDMSDKELVKLMYDGGFLAARAIDKYLIDISEGKTELIDVIRSIYESTEYGSKLDERTFIVEVKEITGNDISEYLRRLVHSPAPDIILGVEGKMESRPLTPS
ncbi:hypothetical protein J7M07_00905 [bacterium]|nr:hypothetical protein [bacterium]